MSAVDLTFAALGDPTRLAIVKLLANGPLRPSEIADALDQSRPLTSRHLRVLRKAGLVQDQVQSEDARQRVYELRQEPFSDIHDFLAEVEAFWNDQLLAFKAHAEASKRSGRSITEKPAKKRDGKR